MQNHDVEAGQAGWAALAAGVAAAVCRSPVGAAGGRNRCAAHMRARRLALHLAHVGLGASLTRSAGMFARHRAAARRACAQVEEGRDRLPWDRALDGLERALRVWVAAFGAAPEGSR